VLLASITATVTEWLTSLVGDHGLYAVFLLMLIDAVLPAASELVMLYAGALAAGAFPGQDVVLFGREIEGFWAYFAMSMAGLVGYTIGSVIGWWIGYYGGRPLIERHGRWLHLGPENVERAEKWFERWGDWAVFLSRMTPVIRSFVSIPAGVAKMPLLRFTVLTFLGSIPWCFGIAGAGYALGTRYEEFHHNFRYADYTVAALLVALAVLWWVRRRRTTKLARRASDTTR
jgi:membrane protein DedA with SNARE-associated domain